ncbi:MAG TPA: DUF1622 domain-containing protein [Acidocella sp.]|uniref:DUF1622 domain-containing protein n=1 Tax=Acidocella sp. TaxID=50710 RepID=UPI002CDD39EC|nr:DUF1622 domain-containing protein [Acidocella sp.]HVE23351.1 DUF1622 domain-containing protein [Acidocella sp.]
MEEIIRRLCSYSALYVEAVAALVITYATIEALVRLVPSFVGRGSPGRRRAVWRRLGVWLLLGLEFELAADIIRSAIAPTWTDIGQLAAIAAIRTFLNHFLETDIATSRAEDESQPPANAQS